MHICNWEAIDRIPGYMTREECEWLAHAASNVRSWTELGAYCGRSMLAVGLHLPEGASLRVVDLYLGQIIRAGQSLFTTVVELKQKRPDIELLLVSGESKRAAHLLPESEVVFIDAGHTYEDVMGDILAWHGKCKKLLCGHDLNYADWPEVGRAVRSLIPAPANPAGAIWSKDLPFVLNRATIQ